jgi:hypothetical protein
MYDFTIFGKSLFQGIFLWLLILAGLKISGKIQALINSGSLRHKSRASGIDTTVAATTALATEISLLQCAQIFSVPVCDNIRRREAASSYTGHPTGEALGMSFHHSNGGLLTLHPASSPFHFPLPPGMALAATLRPGPRSTFMDVDPQIVVQELDSYHTLKIFGIPDKGLVVLSDANTVQYSGPIELQIDEGGTQKETLLIQATPCESNGNSDARKTFQLRKPITARHIYVTDCPRSRIVIQRADNIFPQQTCVLFAKNSKLEIERCFFNMLTVASDGDTDVTCSATTVMNLVWEASGQRNHFGSPVILGGIRYQCSMPDNSISAFLEQGVMPITDLNTQSCCRSHFLPKDPGATTAAVPTPVLPPPTSTSPPRPLPQRFGVMRSPLTSGGITVSTRIITASAAPATATVQRISATASASRSLVQVTTPNGNRIMIQGPSSAQQQQQQQQTNYAQLPTAVVMPHHDSRTADVPEGWNGAVCQICQTAHPNTVSKPCNHHVYCAPCMARAHERSELLGRPCIVCKSTIVNDVQVLDLDSFVTEQMDTDRRTARSSSQG